jgi:hypothetical protein
MMMGTLTESQPLKMQPHLTGDSPRTARKFVQRAIGSPHKAVEADGRPQTAARR